MYEKYEEKIKRIAETLRKYRFLIAGILAALFVAFVVLFGIGIVFSKVRCRSVTYGDSLAPKAKSSTHIIRYEYCPAAGGEWTKTKPTEAGQYIVRAKSVSLFGIRIDAGRAETEILPKTLKITPQDITVYDDISTALPSAEKCEIEGLVYGDRVTEIQFEFLPDTQTETRIEYQITGITVVHKDGSDASSCYKLDAKKAVVIDDRIKLVLRAESRKLVYSGNPNEEVTADEVKIASGKLKEGHSLDFHATGKQIGIGSSDNPVDLGNGRIVDELGNNVTNQYRITAEDGLLTLEPKSITVVTDSAEKKYDGLPLQKDGFTFRGEGLCPGDHFDAHCVSVIVWPGVIDNIYEQYKIVSDTYGDVTDCYQVRNVWGKLKITSEDDQTIRGADQNAFSLDRSGNRGSGNGGGNGKPAIVFSFKARTYRTYYFRECTYGVYDGSTWYRSDAEKQYAAQENYLTGKTLQKNDYEADRVTIRKLRLNHRIYPYFMTGAETDSTEDYYDYSCTVYSLPKDKTYTDYPADVSDPFMEAYDAFAYSTYLDVPADVKSVLLELGAEAGIRADDWEIIQEIAEYIQHAAVYDMDYPTFPQGEDMVLYFLTKSKRGICQHYASAATLMYRAYGIPARFTVGLVKTGGLDRWVDVGTDVGHAWVEVYLAGTGWIPVEVTGTGDGTDAPFDEDGNGGNGGGGGGGGGSMEIDINLLVAFEQYTKVYDGNTAALENPDWSLELGSLAPGDYIVASAPSVYAPPEVGEYSEEATVRVYNSAGQDVTDKYIIIVMNPEIRIEQRKIEITTYGKEGNKWDGTISSNQWFLSKGALVNGDYIDLTLTAKQDTVGTTRNWPDVLHIYNKNGEDVTSMYSISYIPGTLEMKDENK